MSAAREAAPQAAPEELEAKLIAPDELRLPDLSGLIKGATAVRPPGRHLDAIYFDTADLRLARNGITLRYRSGEDGPPWTVKLPEGSSHAALRRQMNAASSTALTHSRMITSAEPKPADSESMIANTNAASAPAPSRVPTVSTRAAAGSALSGGSMVLIRPQPAVVRALNLVDVEQIITVRTGTA